MALRHAMPGEAWDVLPAEPSAASSLSSTIFKSEQLEVVRLVMKAGKSLPPHKVAGEITIQCIVGELAVGALGTTKTLSAGQLLYLPGEALHDVLAVQDAVSLVTIALGKRLD